MSIKSEIKTLADKHSIRLVHIAGKIKISEWPTNPKELRGRFLGYDFATALRKLQELFPEPIPEGSKEMSLQGMSQKERDEAIMQLANGSTLVFKGEES